MIKSAAFAAAPPTARKLVRKVLKAATSSLAASILTAAALVIIVFSVGDKAGFQRLPARSSCNPLTRAKPSASATRVPGLAALGPIAVASFRGAAVQSKLTKTVHFTT